MSDLLIQGLEISFLGMTLTFAALGILILTMILLERAFRPKPAAAVEHAVTAPAAAEEIAADSQKDEEIAAAIAAALAYLGHRQAKGRASLGESLTAGRGGYWAAGQAARASQFKPTSRGNG